MVHESASARAVTTPREQRREATTARILETAQRILETDGLEALTMQRLAGELGYTVGATYRYFASKDEIVAALQRRVFESLAEDLRDALARFEERRPRPGMLTALTKVAIVARVYASLGARRPTDARLLARMLGDPTNVLTADLADANTQLAIRIGAQALQLLAGARAERALSEGDDVERGLVLWASLQGIAQTRKLERWAVPGLASDALAEALVRALLVGWGAEPSRAKEALARAAEIV